MLVATITTLLILFHGAAGLFSFDIFKAGVEDGLADKARVKQIVRVIEAADDEIDAYNKRRNKSAKELVKLNEDYHTTRAETEHYLARTDDDREAFQERLIDLRMQLKPLVTEKEWETIYAETLPKLSP